jgi:hypothetical protein
MEGGDRMLKISNASTETTLSLEAGAEAGTIDLIARTPQGKTVPLMNFKEGGKVTRYASVPAGFALPVTRSGRVRVVLYR